MRKKNSLGWLVHNVFSCSWWLVFVFCGVFFGIKWKANPTYSLVKSNIKGKAGSMDDVGLFPGPSVILSWWCHMGEGAERTCWHLFYYETIHTQEEICLHSFAIPAGLTCLQHLIGKAGGGGGRSWTSRVHKFCLLQLSSQARWRFCWQLLIFIQFFICQKSGTSMREWGLYDSKLSLLEL